VLTSSDRQFFYYLECIFVSFKASCFNQEVNCTKPSLKSGFPGSVNGYYAFGSKTIWLTDSLKRDLLNSHLLIKCVDQTLRRGQISVDLMIFGK
jgi:hypothetical protein